MHKINYFLLIVGFTFCISFLFGQNTAPSNSNSGEKSSPGSWALVIHGGAGGPAKGAMPAAKEKEYLARLDEALTIGAKMLESGSGSLDVVEAVVRYMEDCPLFNAGKGAVLDKEGFAELDASIMDGRTGMAGAVAGVRTVKNPITAARTVMEKTNHVLLAGEGADKFAKIQGLEIVDPSYFITPERFEAWKKWKEGQGEKVGEKDKHGTVGAVAVDKYGNLAAATSTGGMMGKAFGRIGDSPVIGAGTFARNATCAVSCTGHGEYFIRNAVAYDLSALIEYKGLSLETAANQIIFEKLKPQGGAGGLIAIDREGHIAMPFNTNAMFRGYIRSDGTRETAIY